LFAANGQGIDAAALQDFVVVDDWVLPLTRQNVIYYFKKII